VSEKSLFGLEGEITTTDRKLSKIRTLIIGVKALDANLGLKRFGF